MIDHQDYYSYPSYYYWVLLLGVDALIIFRPWLLFMGSKNVYSYTDFYETSHLVSSNFEMAENSEEKSLKYMTGIRTGDLLFFKYVYGLVSEEAYIEVNNNLISEMAMMFAIGSVIITFISFVFFVFIPWLAVVHLVLYTLAWVLALKF